MARVIDFGLERCLVAEGLVPDDCHNIHLDFTAHAAPVLRYELFLTEDRLARFQRAFAAYLAEKAAKAARVEARRHHIAHHVGAIFSLCSDPACQAAQPASPSEPGLGITQDGSTPERMRG
jgi:hypothetical protein